MTDLTRPAAHEMADGLRRGDFSARELTDAHLAAIEKTDRPLHAWVGRRRRCAGHRPTPPTRHSAAACADAPR